VRNVVGGGCGQGRADGKLFPGGEIAVIQSRQIASQLGSSASGEAADVGTQGFGQPWPGELQFAEELHFAEAQRALEESKVRAIRTCSNATLGESGGLVLCPPAAS